MAGTATARGVFQTRGGKATVGWEKPASKLNGGRFDGSEGIRGGRGVIQRKGSDAAFIGDVPMCFAWGGHGGDCHGPGLFSFQGVNWRRRGVQRANYQIIKLSTVEGNAI